jgi:hypothetical protein
MQNTIYNIQYTIYYIQYFLLIIINNKNYLDNFSYKIKNGK